jgi:hypothetical protein
MMASPGFAMPFPGNPYPSQPFLNPSSPWPGNAAVQQQPPPRPLIRAKGADDPRAAIKPPPPPSVPSRLAMPTPDQLGISSAKFSAAEAADWTSARRRLDRLGAVCFHLEKIPAGGFRFTCLLPTSQPKRTHRVEAVAATEAEVVRLVLDKSEEWATSR